MTYSRCLGFWCVAVAVLPAALSPASAQEVATGAKRAFDFEEPTVSFRADFPGARLSDCTRRSEAEYEARILPENTPINNSAWYAFQVTSGSPHTITVRLTYEDGTHRYHPKISRDGARWTPLGPQAYTRDKAKGEATLRLDVGPEPLWVAAQELVTSKELNAWTDKIANLDFVRKGVLGRSVLGRPIYKLQTTGAEPSRCVFIIGRQHPPEVTGSFGLMEFVETLLGDTELAKRFRARFQLVVVPLVNPDGVDAGYWRHNMNGVDLNRDWDTFAQPETRALRDELVKFKSDRGRRLYLFLDFHSTHRDVFYTQPDDAKTFPEGFTRKWLDAIGARFPDYRMNQVGSHGTTLNTSKRWVYEVFGCPSITYEFGDHTDRALIRRISRGAAEAMMRLLVAEVDSTKNRAARRDHLPTRCFWNHATVASDVFEDLRDCASRLQPTDCLPPALAGGKGRPPGDSSRLQPGFATNRFQPAVCHIPRTAHGACLLLKAESYLSADPWLGVIVPRKQPWSVLGSAGLP